MTRAPECILHPALSAILSIQPSVLDEIMSNTTMTGRGLIARFLYSSPPSRIGGRTFRAPSVSPEVSAAYRNLIFHLMALPITEEPQTLHLSEKAFDLMADYFRSTKSFWPERDRPSPTGRASISVQCSESPDCFMVRIWMTETEKYPFPP